MKVKRSRIGRRRRAIYCPWWIWPLLGLGGLLGWLVAHRMAVCSRGEYTTVVGALAGGFFRSRVSLDTALALAFALCIAGLVHALRAEARGHVLDVQRDLNTIKALDWREFENLVAEAYRRLGFSVEVTGGGGADGGVDLILRRGGEVILVQCKQWRLNSIGAPVVREMAGLMLHHGATEVKIVCVGRFTKDASAFALGKAIELVSGADLVSLVKSVQRGSSRAIEAGAPMCPDCGSAMCRRYSAGRGAFWGCTAYPKCKGVRSNNKIGAAA
jgi:restriction system protein